MTFLHLYTECNLQADFNFRFYFDIFLGISFAHFVFIDFINEIFDCFILLLDLGLQLSDDVIPICELVLEAFDGWSESHGMLGRG